LATAGLRRARERFMLAILASISLWQLLILLAVVLLLFGSRLPSLARSLGQSIVEFKKGIKEIEDQSTEKSEDKK
jgi:sec-independent protein translocase protein TatA